MAKQIERLTPLQVKNLKEPGKHADGDGLYLIVAPGGSKSWLYSYRDGARRPQLGLGSFPAVSLKAARQKAGEFRELKSLGGDPLATKRQAQAAKRRVEKPLTFKEAATLCEKAKRAGWKAGKHRDQWLNPLTTYVFPVIGSTPVHEVDNAMMARVLAPIWTTKNALARKLRGKIEMVLDWARVMGHRPAFAPNPAAYVGNLQHLLPKGPRKSQRKHFAAIPYPELPALFAQLREESGIVALALQFAILTAARTNEVRLARWSEIDWERAAWSVPADRMKGDRAEPHVVMLSPEALAILRKLFQVRADRENDGYIFTGRKAGSCMSDMAMLEAMRRLRDDDATVHGTARASFTTFAKEKTAYRVEVIDHCLAHVVGDQVVAAYDRAKFLADRRALMEAWSKHCCGAPAVPKIGGKVVPLRKAS